MSLDGSTPLLALRLGVKSTICNVSFGKTRYILLNVDFGICCSFHSVKFLINIHRRYNLIENKIFFSKRNVMLYYYS